MSEETLRARAIELVHEERRRRRGARVAIGSALAGLTIGLLVDSDDGQVALIAAIASAAILASAR